MQFLSILLIYFTGKTFVIRWTDQLQLRRENETLNEEKRRFYKRDIPIKFRLKNMWKHETNEIFSVKHKLPICELFVFFGRKETKTMCWRFLYYSTHWTSLHSFTGFWNFWVLLFSDCIFKQSYRISPVAQIPL